MLSLVVYLSVSVAQGAQATTLLPHRLFPVSRDHCHGYIDSTGGTIIPLQFDEAWSFAEGLAVVRIGGPYGYIDTLGSYVIEPQFEYAESFSEGLAVVGTRGRRYYIDRMERVVIGPKFDVGSPSGFHEGRARASIGGVAGYIDRTGTMVIRSQSRSINPDFSDGLVAMEVGGKWGFMDTTGTMVIEPRFEMYPFHSTFHRGLAPVPIDGRWGFIDRTGRVVIPAQFDNADSFGEDGLARVRVGDRWGYVDTTGALVIAPQFADTWGFTEGLAPTRVGDKWGYIDRTGQLAVAAEFDGEYRLGPVFGPVGYFRGGIARVRSGEDYGYIDRSGRFVWRAPFSVPFDPTTCAATPSQQVAPAPRADAAAAPAVAGAGRSSAAARADSSRPILYYEELDGEPVLTGLFLDGRRVAVRADNATTMPMWSPDGAWAAYGTRDSATHSGVLALVDVDGERRELLTVRDSVPIHPRWSPDGRFVAVLLIEARETAGEGDTLPATIPLAVVGVADQAVHARIAIPTEAVAARHGQPKVRWSPDGLKIFVAGGMGVAVVATVATGVIDTVAPHAITAEWGATSDAVYYFAPDSAGSPTGLGAFFLRRLDEKRTSLLAGSDRIAPLGIGGITFTPPSRRVTLSPDGRRLAIWGHPSMDSTVVLLYDVTSGNPIDPATPAAAFRLSGAVLGLQWGQQGQGIAALVPAEQGLEVRYLDVGTGAWRTLAMVRAGGASDYYGFGILSLSWTQ